MEKIKALYHKYEDIIRYVFFGGLTTVVSFASHFIARFAGAELPQELTIRSIKAALDNSLVSAELATTISWVCAVTFAFFTNKIFVFRSKEKGKGILREALMFYGARLTSYWVEVLMMFVFVTKMEINELLIKILAQGVILAMNYLFSKFIVFRRKKEPDGEKTE